MFLAPAPALAGPPDELWASCVNDADRSAVRDFWYVCDDKATAGGEYNVGVFRPCTVHDEENGTSQCSKVSCFARCVDPNNVEACMLICDRTTCGNGCCPDHFVWVEDTKYLCLGAPGK